jgi:predicted esterase
MTRILLLILCVCLFVPDMKAQDACVNYGPEPAGSFNPAWNFPSMKQKKRTGLTIPGTTRFSGLLEYLPTGYNDPGNSDRYPVIIYFHGIAGLGAGTTNSLCKLFHMNADDRAGHKSIPGQVENNTSAFTVTQNGDTYEYIVISPQYNVYNFLSNPKNFPSYNDVDAIIDYVEATYRVDSRRIYLTGLSGGANMIMEYVGQSVTNAQRVAAVAVTGLCSSIDTAYHIANGMDAANVAEAGLPTWFVHCNIDNACPLSISSRWVDSIERVPGFFQPDTNFVPADAANPLYECSDSLLHDMWSRFYDPAFVGADGRNLYNWFIQYQAAVLPVTLTEFTTRLNNGRVFLRWTTTNEKDNAYFSVERAGADGVYKEIHRIPGVTGGKDGVYQYIDDNPLKDLSYYRLVQYDIDGKKHYMPIRKVINHDGVMKPIIVSPNPFNRDISIFINVERTQKVGVHLSDMSGKRLKSSVGVFAPGNTEVNFTTADLPKGIYLLKVEGENFSKVEKVIKR